MNARDLSRRTFLRHALGSSLGITAVSALTDLRLINHALAEQSLFTDYKALVCIFLDGGNDSDNILVPATGPAYNGYVTGRGGPFNADPTLGGLGLLPVDYTGTLPRVVPLNVIDNVHAHDFGVHSSFASTYTNGVPQDGIARLFNDGKAAFVANAGVLVEPINRAQYRGGTRRRPPQLFSHSDQVYQWQTSLPDKITRTGWGGRMADRPYIFGSNNGSPISMSISLAGTNTWEVGDIIHQYQITTNGAASLTGTTGSSANAARLSALRDVLALNRANLAEKDYKTVFDRALNNATLLSNALTSADAGNNGSLAWANSPIGIATRPTTGPLRNNSLATQLNMVARLINARHNGLLNMRRQIFFVRTGGYDTHSSQRDSHANNLLRPLSDAVWAFQQTIEAMSVSQGVTGFTISDFGRTFKNNDTGIQAGSDHGWGSHQVVFGGAVRGSRIYGTYPTLQVNGPDDTSDGRWIPTTSTDEFGATLARWFGVTEPDLTTIFPNLPRFPRPDLGFLG
ncbi:MAG: DUF1501 domain-containing protein [Verrucomicrobiales bacterium]